MGNSTNLTTLFFASLLLASGCWRMQDVGQHSPDGGDTDGDTEETDGITDPDTGWVGQWTYTEMETPVTQDLAAVWGTWFGNVWAVGEDGVILHFDGTGWSLVEYDADAHPNLHAIAGASADRIWAAGAERFMLEFDGDQWTQQATVFDPPQWPGGYRGVCTEYPEAAYVVGDGATIVAYTGWEWSFGKDLGDTLNSDFHAITCGIGTDAFIAGHDHAAFSSSVLIRYTPLHDWSLMAHEPSDNMYGITSGGDGDVWAVGFDDGQGSRLYRLSGNDWFVEQTSDHELLGLWAHSTLGLWAVGNTADDDAIGVLEAWDTSGDLQYELEYDGTTRLRGIWGVDNVSDKHLFAVGKNGTILHIFWDPL